MKIKYAGHDHVRIISSTDLDPELTDPLLTWEWNEDNNHIVEVPDHAGEMLLRVPGFIEAGADEDVEAPAEEADESGQQPPLVAGDENAQSASGSSADSPAGRPGGLAPL